MAALFERGERLMARINRIDGVYHTDHTSLPYCPKCGHEISSIYSGKHRCDNCGAMVVTYIHPIEYSTYVEVTDDEQ